MFLKLISAPICHIWLIDEVEIFGGEVLCNPEIASVNIALIEQCKNNSRQDDNFFSYYE
jgi:hypothetical protein